MILLKGGEDKMEKNKQAEEINKQTEGVNKQLEEDQILQKNQCPETDEEGNCLTPGTFSNSHPIGGG